MLGKGLKRKLEQEEENGVMKMASPQEVSPTCYWLQRQTVLNLSLLKLHSRPGHTDPGLARRVLITNTLRHIQDELRGEEGVLLPPSVPRQQPPSSPVIKDSFSAALAEIESLCPTVGITALFSTEAARSNTSDQNMPDITSSTNLIHSGESRNTDPDLSEMHSSVDPPIPLSDSAQSALSHTPSFLADFSLDDFLFTEIDNILFDNSPCSSSLSGTSGTSRVISMVTDDFVKTLTGYGNGGASQSALPSNQTFKLDLNELDHIMEVLVGS
ncbi:SERTA domain-containing protein 2 [Megalobrama amblycephala]|uniref:SERTA domain-containing protein 2 n=1 Tax=Megalobrama amblycephala TaxID=75352 RepID=UPI00201446F1|nr:SERTA domain-containing protein 2 [Megalobrama amblycephala]